MPKSLWTRVVGVVACSVLLSCGGGGGKPASTGSGGQTGGAGHAGGSAGTLSGGGGGKAGGSGGAAGGGAVTTGGGGALGTGGAPGTGGALGTGGSTVSMCSGPGAVCSAPTDCCNLQCDSATGRCTTATSCTADGQSCTSSSACCGGNCTGGTCQALNATCKTAGNPCSATDAGAGGGCCSGLCTGGKCVLGASFCIQPGDVCARDTDCCGGVCAKASGASLGTCQDVATTGTGSCQHDGVLCNGCGSCCSKNCGPWALTGVSVCQPGLGCKILNSLCTTDAECCGSDTGTVMCLASTTSTGMSIGVCAQNHGNQVPGGICKLTGGTNACSNAESDCICAIDPKVACCAYDTLGLPRCLGSGTCSDGSTGVFAGTDPKCCRQGGQTCNTSAECCGLIPCVPDSTGVRRCLTTPPNDAGVVCVSSGGACTATGDCCTGMVCNITPGAPNGTCGTPPPPNTGDGGVPTDGPPPPYCALYGQACGGDVQCCTGLCTYSPTNTACAGQQGCTCYNP